MFLRRVADVVRETLQRDVHQGWHAVPAAAACSAIWNSTRPVRVAASWWDNRSFSETQVRPVLGYHCCCAIFIGTCRRIGDGANLRRYLGRGMEAAEVRAVLRIRLK
jgi:hypothetical protein